MATAQTGYTAPVLSVDLDAAGEIWPCHDCLPWHVEIVRDAETGDVLAREWHAAECPTLAMLLTPEA